MFINGVLKEELANSLRIKNDHQRAISSLPRGSLVKKNIRGRDYYYMAVRNGKKVSFAYKGKLSKEDIVNIKSIRIKRLKLKKQLAEVNKQIKYLRKILRGKKPS